MARDHRAGDPGAVRPDRSTEGHVLAGRYELGAVLGRGGMAEVRAGKDLRLGRAVAVKTLLPDLAEQPAIRRRFEGEARAAARLAHPNAVAVFDVGEEEGVPYLVMEQIVGPTLEQELARGPVDAGRARRLGEDMLAALGAAHAAGLVHRDMKPSNVLMAPDGSAKVADFGIAKAADEGTASQTDLTIAGQLLGTVAYMAPERLAGRPATVQSDVYSVGVVLYEALTGDRPFAATSPVAMVRAIDRASPAPLTERCPGLDTALLGAVERAMAKDPEDRFASAAEMSAALRARAAAPGVDPAPTVAVAPAVISDSPLTAVLADPPVEATSPLRRDRPTVAGRLTRRWIPVLVTVAGLAVALVVANAGGDNEKASSGGTPAPTTLPPAGTGIPADLDDALRRLEGTLR